MKVYRFNPYLKNGKENSVLCIPKDENSTDNACVINAKTAGLQNSTGYFLGTPYNVTMPDGGVIRSVTVEKELTLEEVLKANGKDLNEIIRSAIKIDLDDETPKVKVDQELDTEDDPF